MRLRFTIIPLALSLLIGLQFCQVTANSIISTEIPLSSTIQMEAFEICEDVDIRACLLLSIVYQESKGNVEHVKKKYQQGSKYRGICQCNTYYFRDYLEELNITASDIDDSYYAMLLCATFLEDMMQKYDDEKLAVMCWAMGEQNAVRTYRQGYIISYAKSVTERADDWEWIWNQEERREPRWMEQ